MPIGSYVSGCRRTANGGDSGGFYPIAEGWNGKRWLSRHPVQTPLQETGLAGVSCVSVILCEVVGSRASTLEGVYTAPLAERAEVTGWSVQPVPPLAGQTFVSLRGVSCESAVCFAVGGGTVTAAAPAGGVVPIVERYAPMLPSPAVNTDHQLGT